MRTSDFHYELPEELIAQQPASKRDDSRLLRLNKQGEIEDSQFHYLPEYLQSGDLLVLNNTRVIPARLFLAKETGGQVEVMLERIIDSDTVLAQIRASKSPKPSSCLLLGKDICFQVLGRQDDMFFLKYIGKTELDDFLQMHGHMPLPPYITRADNSEDLSRYQTVFAKHSGAVAAPTAGLHFTESMLNELAASGINHTFLTLHVGAGTFKPVRVDDVTQHHMHSEVMEVTQESIDTINEVKKKGGRIVAVGTTVVRSLETAASSGELTAYSGETDIFIYPGFRFNVVDMLVTNFHLPESTLLMLVSAFAGIDNIRRAYEHAVRERYRFFSYGDAMLLERS